MKLTFGVRQGSTLSLAYAQVRPLYPPNSRSRTLMPTVTPGSCQKSRTSVSFRLMTSWHCTFNLFLKRNLYFEEKVCICIARFRSSLLIRCHLASLISSTKMDARTSSPRPGQSPCTSVPCPVLTVVKARLHRTYSGSGETRYGPCLSFITQLC